MISSQEDAWENCYNPYGYKPLAEQQSPQKNRKDGLRKNARYLSDGFVLPFRCDGE